MEVFHNDANEHVEDEKADEEDEGDEEAEAPLVVVADRLFKKPYKRYRNRIIFNMCASVIVCL